MSSHSAWLVAGLFIATAIMFFAMPSVISAITPQIYHTVTTGVGLGILMVFALMVAFVAVVFVYALNTGRQNGQGSSYPQGQR